MTLHQGACINGGFIGIVFVPSVRGSFCIYAESKQESHTRLVHVPTRVYKYYTKYLCILLK
jgi:hypothetical protein